VGIDGARRSTLLAGACEWFGDPTEELEVMGVDEVVPGWHGTDCSTIWRLLSYVAYPVYQLLSGRGRCFLPCADPEAFPERSPASAPMRAMRRFGRWLLRVPQIDTGRA
jgi:hypothetical protein